MLTKPTADKEIMQALVNGIIARDPNTGAHLNRSRGRSRGATSYFLVIPSRQQANQNSLKIKAWSDDEAIEIANDRLAKHEPTQARDDER